MSGLVGWRGATIPMRVNDDMVMGIFADATSKSGRDLGTAKSWENVSWIEKMHALNRWPLCGEMNITRLDEDLDLR